MDRESAGKVVVAFYNAWNERIPRGADWDELLAVWARFLSDVSVEEARHAYRRLVALDPNWLPRPGTVRRTAISSRGGQPPREWEAWAQLRRIADASHSGVAAGERLDPVVAATLASLGGREALELHTNGDRELFFRAYREKLADWETSAYGVPPADGRS